MRTEALIARIIWICDLKQKRDVVWRGCQLIFIVIIESEAKRSTIRPQDGQMNEKLENCCKHCSQCESICADQSRNLGAAVKKQKGKVKCRELRKRTDSQAELTLRQLLEGVSVIHGVGALVSNKGFMWQGDRGHYRPRSGTCVACHCDAN